MIITGALLGLLSCTLSCQKNTPAPSPSQNEVKQTSQQDQPPPKVQPPAPSRLELFTVSLGKPINGELVAQINTSKGTLHCTLFEQDAPITVTNFVGLAMGKLDWISPSTQEHMTQQPFYDGLHVFRVIPDFLIQTGDPLNTGTGGPGYTIPDEIVDTLRHDKPGVLSMANAGPNTGSSQFFITAQAAPHLDGKHTIFGQCAPKDIIFKISRSPADAQDHPVEPVTIDSITFSREQPTTAN